MNARDVLFLAIGFIALLTGGYYLYTQQPAQQAILFPTLEWDYSSSANVGDAVPIRLLVTHYDQQPVFLEVDGNRFTQACTSNPCTLVFPLHFSKPGLYSMKARLGKWDSTRTISIKDTQTRCIDGTLGSACATPPMQCTSGKLVSRCSVCGCPEGLVCENDACITPSIRVGIPQLHTSALTPTMLRTIFTLRNDSTISLDGLFVLQLDLYDNAEQVLLSVPQQIRITNLSPQDTQTVHVDSAMPARGARAGGKIYSISASGDRGSLVGETSSTYPFSVISDPIPPAPPTNAYGSTLDGQTLLAWDASPSPDVVGYAIYRENFDSEQFTTYALLAEVASSPYAVPLTSTPLHYVIRAKDAAGNLSDPSASISLGGGNST